VTLTCATHVREKLPTFRGALAVLACRRSFVAVYIPYTHARNTQCGRDPQIFQESRSQLQILGSRGVIQIKYSAVIMQKMLGVSYKLSRPDDLAFRIPVPYGVYVNHYDFTYFFCRLYV
jgi:hypothetical protein